MFYSSLAAGDRRGALEMVFIVNAENRHLFEHDLLEMHAQRRRVFVERLGWPLPSSGALESDQYDGDDVIYLLVKDDPRGRLRASVRLLRTDRPHPLLDLFHDLCDDPVPQGANVWEVSRFCANPSLTSRRDRLALLWQIICASLETALLFDIEQLTFVANRALRPLALNCGWDAVSLGATRPDRHDEVTAIAAGVTRAGLRRVRERFGIAGPVIRFYPASTAARVAA
jgi:acyl-homoserine lactone synthase